MRASTQSLQAMRRQAEQIFSAGLKAANPFEAVKRHVQVDGKTLIVAQSKWDLSQFKQIYVVGAGKASAAMAAALEEILSGQLKAGHITVKYGHGQSLKRIVINQAGHPLSDQNGVDSATEIAALAQKAGCNDLVFGLFSGGGSALLPMPAMGLTLAEKQKTIKALLECGASIHEINSVRKHLSAIKGGQLAQMTYPAKLIALILSDVVGDDLDVIASGPTVPDSSTFADALSIIKNYRLAKRVPDKVISHLHAGVSGKIAETPKSDNPVFKNTTNCIIGSNRSAILAAKRAAVDLGYNAFVLSSMIEGETEPVARMHAAIVKEIVTSGNPVSRPACILSGGETTVTITGNGLGGRNQEFALAAVADVAGLSNVVMLSAGTDGSDGPTEAAGAWTDTTSAARAKALGLDPKKYLAENDSYHFFKTLGDLYITGPTLTNVMDLRVILIT
jgi:glycerate 2-kinase